MADQKISELTAITGANTADDDELVIVDTSASQTKKITLGELENALAERDFSFGDNDKLTFGDGSDLQIYSNGDNTFISEQSTTGGLYILADNIDIKNSANNETKAQFNSNGAVTLYYDNAAKLATTSTGVDITGTLTSDGLTVQTTNGLNAVLEGTTSYQYLQFKNSGETENYLGFVNDDFTVTAGNTKYLQVEGNGDISFYEDTGSTPKMVWKAADERLGIGTSSPATMLNLSGDETAVIRLDNSNGSASDGDVIGALQFYKADGSGAGAGVVGQVKMLTQGVGSGGHLILSTGDSSGNDVERVRITSNGNFGIGTSSPSAKLDVAETDSVTYSSSAVQGDLVISRKNSANTVNQVVGLEFDVTGWSGSTTGVAGISAIQTGSNASSAALAFQTRSSGTIAERMRITSSGSVGIGTSSPSTILQVTGNSTSRNTIVSNFTLDGGTSVANPYENFGFGINFIGRDYGNAVRNYASINTVMEHKSSSSGGGDAGFETGLSFYTNGGGASDTDPTERMRIDSSGNVGIGNTAASSMYGTGSMTIGTGVSGQSAVHTIYSNSDTYGAVYFADGTSGSARYAGGMDYSHINNSLKLYTSSTERMRIDSSGNVGIGTSSPSSMLDVAGDAEFESGKIIINEVTGADAYSEIRKTNGGSNFAISSPESIYMLIDSNNDQTNRSFNVGHNSTGPSGSSTLFTVNESGRVGIGTSSPNRPLTVSTANNVPAEFDHTDGTDVWLKLNNTTQNYYIGYLGTDFVLSPDTSSRDLTIDSSGNLLVGKSVTTFANNGIALRSSGETNITRNNGVPLYIRRNTSDGGIVRFWKDGTTVGSIGTFAGDFVIGSSSGSDAAFRMDGTNNAIYASNTSGNARDAAIDLGASTVRWKDLYLSGGVYLGGTGSANKLDDYEEGTYTATLDFTSGSVGYSNNTLTYTKIGRVVWVQGRILLNAASSPSGGLGITLPFTVSQSGYAKYSHLTASWYVLDVPSNTVQANFTVESGTVARLLYLTDGGAWSIVDASGLASNSQIQVSGFYIT